MTDAERTYRRAGSAALLVAAVAFTTISLGGPLLLASGRDLDLIAPFVPFLWALVIVCALLWLRCWSRAAVARRAAEGRGETDDA